MKILLPNEYFIVLDTNGNYTLYKTMIYQEGKNIGKAYDTVVGYYSNVPSAVNRYIAHNLSSGGETVSLEEYLNRYEELKNEVIGTLQPQGVKLK